MIERIRFSSRKSSMLPWLAIAIFVVVLDQLSKIVVVKNFAYGESKAILPFFNLVLAYNEGAAFSFLASQSGWQRYFFVALTIGVGLFILYLLRRHAHQRMFSFALALILGGAIGNNLIDRVVYGYVIDFLDFHVAGWHWPAFNVADCAICIGAALFVLDELRRAKRKR